ncbi:MAG: chemotaxis protein CheA [Alphaproteobacteria bacterium]|nr:MAG: chemotaxis protein CheA [Alphaproteobacteria bacterium]
MTDTPFDQFRRTFFEECADLLTMAEGELRGLDLNAPNSESLHAIFRAVHSIKGGAGAFGFDRLVAFAHGFESTLDALRDHRLRLDRDHHDLIMRAFDVLADLVQDAHGESPMQGGSEQDIADALTRWRGDTASPAPLSASPAAHEKNSGGGCYLIRFTPNTQMLAKANEPLLILRELKRLGQATITVDLSRLPGLCEMSSQESYLSWTIELHTAHDLDRVRETFEFVLDDCELSITEHDTRKTEAPAAEGTEAPRGQTSAASPTSMRVDIDKVDRLVNMVGEIVITQAMLSQQIAHMQIDKHQELMTGIEQMAWHTRELQESVMAIRAQPVRSVFQRMPRLVRELSFALGKEVRLVTEGENTEVDKTVIEQLSDPLTHLIRNSVDHGIETPDQREVAEKPRIGTITLSAAHRHGRIVIAVDDDGAGLNLERIRARAIERGLIDAQADLDQEAILNLIFLPGFSTAAAVTNISGRGVGMDVVKRNVQAMGGRVTVESRPGQGARFTLSLPLTLAVLDGMLVRAGGERYVIPLAGIIESICPAPGMVAKLVGCGDVLHIRGEYVRLIPLHTAFNLHDDAQTNGLVVLVEAEGGRRAGFIVDEIIGQQQVVIKSMETNYTHIPGISAATILGDGRVALILDISGLMDMRMMNPSSSFAPDTTAYPLSSDCLPS